MAAKKKKVTIKTVRAKINPESGLSDRHEEFCREYLADFNGTRAAIQAGFAKKAAAQQASRLLTNAKITEYLKLLQSPTIKQFEVTQERIMAEVASLAFSNIMDFVEVKDGQAWIDLSKCSREQAAALAGFEVIELPPFKTVQDGEEVVREVLKVKIKLWDKMPALEALMKRYDLVKPDKLDVTHSGSVDIADKSALAREVAFMLRSERERMKKAARSQPPVKPATPAPAKT